MNLGQIQAEVLNRGFDPTTYGSRIIQFINDGQNLIARRVNFELSSADETFSTMAGTDVYPLPANFGRMREVFITTIPLRLEQVGLTDIDRSSLTTARPSFYAMDGTNIRLYPIPDGPYSMEMRYWAMPTPLVNTTDVPTEIPVDWHQLLWLYATWMCYEADDDAEMGQYWMGRFNTMLSMFTADQRFPSSDYPTRVVSMWGDEQSLTGAGDSWVLYAGW